MSTTIANFHDLFEPQKITGKRYIPVPPFTAPKLVQIPYGRQWPLAEMLGPILDKYRSVLYGAPNIWQMEPIVYNAARALKKAPAIGVAHSMPATADMARQLLPVVVLSEEHAPQFSVALHEQHISEEMFIITINHLSVTEPHFTSFVAPSMRLIELMPGYPLVYTCAKSQKKDLWHLSEEYAWHHEGKLSTISPLAKELPWTGVLELPFTANKLSKCACGKESYELAYDS